MKKTKIEYWVFFLTLLISLSLFYFTALKHSSDDSYILFRYIDNLASGRGFVFNVGERVLGATTPLFTLLATGVKLVFGQFETSTIIPILNILLLSFSSIYFFRLSRKFFSEKISFFATIVFALDLSKIVPEGMETGLFLLCLFAFLVYLLEEKNYVSAILLSLVLLTRPDAGLIAILTFIYWWQRNGFQNAFRYTLTTIAVALPWLVFSTIYFGSFIPQSLLTKFHIKDIVNQPAAQALKVQLSSVSRIYFGKIFDPNSIVLQVLFNLLPIVILFVVAVRKVLDKKNWIIFAIPFVYFVSYSVSNPVMWPWYISQMEPFWIIISFMGISIFFRKIQSYSWKVALAILIISGPLFFWASWTLNKDPGSKMNNVLVADYVRERMKPGESLGVNNIGVLGYYLPEIYIVDFFGLTNDYAVDFYPVDGECIDKTRQYNVPPKLVQFKEPDWVVLAGEGELDPCFIQGAWFKERYTEEMVPGDTGAVVWRKKKNL
ncbi:MAG: hypothetical protein WAW92_04590 [Minisyncoccia bacterium]